MNLKNINQATMDHLYEILNFELSEGGPKRISVIPYEVISEIIEINWNTENSGGYKDLIGQIKKKAPQWANAVFSLPGYHPQKSENPNEANNPVVYLKLNEKVLRQFKQRGIIERL